MKENPRKKGQGTFEYVLLLAGVLLIVVLAIVLLRGGIFGGGAKDIQFQACARQLAQMPGCYDPSTGQISPANDLPALPDACKVYKETYIDPLPDPKPSFSKCGDVFGGMVEQPPVTQIETKSEDNKTGASGIVGVLSFTIKFSPGWNLISIPVALSKNVVCAAYPCPPKLILSVQSTTCDRQTASAWRLDSASQAYAKIDLLDRPVLLDAQESYWAYVPKDCEAVFNGDSPTTLSEWTLRAGWNSIAAPYSETLFDSIKNDCVVESGPWLWDSAALDYLESPSLSPGNGFFVKVTRDCILASVPSALPSA